MNQQKKANMIIAAFFVFGLALVIYLIISTEIMRRDMDEITLSAQEAREAARDAKRATNKLKLYYLPDEPETPDIKDIKK